MMKIYTGRGDDGTTAGSVKGERVPKNHVRIDAFGNIDELNSALGMLRAFLPETGEGLRHEIGRIQSHLLLASSWIATWRGSSIAEQQEKIGEEDIRFLETAIDRMDKKLPELNHFIIPEDHPLPALAHVARTVCRRAERDVIRVSCEVKLEDPPEPLQSIIIYLNRLSDYLFVLGRYSSYLIGETEHISRQGDPERGEEEK